MVKITKVQKEWLINNGYLKMENGRFLGLIVCNKQHNSNSKTYYVEDYYGRLLQIKSKI